jgi:hypothetical protein
MTCSRDEAVGLLKCWQSASAILFAMFLSNGLSLKGVVRVAEIFPHQRRPIIGR